MEHNVVAATAAPKGMQIGKMFCAGCKEGFEPGKSRCYCHELHRRRAYDHERARRGLAALYRPPSMR
jgi:hypothetical protein